MSTTTGLKSLKSYENQRSFQESWLSPTQAIQSTYARVSITLPEFCKECIVRWSLSNEHNPSAFSEKANQVIWNNQFICTESKSIYNSRLIDLGIVRIGDLYNTQGEFKSKEEPLYSALTQVEHFLLFILLNVLFLKNEKY